MLWCLNHGAAEMEVSPSPCLIQKPPQTRPLKSSVRVHCSGEFPAGADMAYLCQNTHLRCATGSWEPYLVLKPGVASCKIRRSWHSRHSLKITFPPLQPCSQILSAERVRAGEKISMAFCVLDHLKTEIPSPGVSDSLSLNYGHENTLTGLTDMSAL